MNAQMLLQYFAGGAEEKTYIEDVFSTYLRTGTGADVTVTNNIDMTKGYMLWSKCRSGATGHAIYDSARGVTFDLASNNTAAQTTQATGLKSVSSNGYTIGSLAKMNTSGATYVDWCFRKSPKFFDVVTYTGNGVAGRQIPHGLGIAPGMIITKIINNSGDWYTYHRSITNNYYLTLNTPNAKEYRTNLFDAEPTDSYFQLGIAGLANQSGFTYVAYLFAHDPSEDGIVQCGSFTTDSSGNATVNLGWEPQWLQIKASSTNGDWIMLDSLRGMSVGGTDARLYANTSGSEAFASTADPTASGFNAISLSANTTYIYTAIRKGPMRG